MAGLITNDHHEPNDLLPPQLSLAEVRDGPWLSERINELLTPGWWPIDILGNPTKHHLGCVRFTVIVSNQLDGSCRFDGVLCDFFPDGRAAMDAGHTSTQFSPHKFLAAKFVRNIQIQFKLGDDDHFKLWLIPSRDTRAYRITSTTQFRLSLIQYYLFFLERPPSRFRVYFVVERIESLRDPAENPSESWRPERWSEVVNLVEDEDIASASTGDQEPVKDIFSDVFSIDSASDEGNPRSHISPQQPPLSSEDVGSSWEASRASQAPSTIYAPSSVYTTQPPEGNTSLLQTRLRTPSPMDPLGSPVIRPRSSVHETGRSESVWTNIIPESSIGDSPEHDPTGKPLEETTDTDTGILRTLDTDARKGDFMEGDLQALLPLSSSPTEDEWKNCCALLNLDPAEHRDPSIRSVAIPGSEIKVSPRQYWTAYKMLTCRQERDICGGMLSDVPGTGKSHVCIVLCLLRALIFQNVVEVEAEWEVRQHEAKRSGTKASRPKKHLPKEASGATECSCANAGGVQCYANPSSITRRIADKLVRGPSLIIAPPGIVEGWAEILMEAKLDKRYQPCFWRGNSSGDKFASLNPPADLHHALPIRVTPAQPSYPPGHNVSVKDGKFSYTPSTLANRHPERFILLAAYNSTKFKVAFQTTMNVPFQKVNGTARQPRALYGCPIGLQIVDEFHLARSPSGSWASELAKEHRHIRGGDFDFWSVTATPMPESIEDMSSLIDILHRSEWDEVGHRHFYKRPSALKELGQAYQAAVADTSTNHDQATFATLAQGLFSDDMIIRHLEISTFFGKPIVNLQVVQPSKHTFTTPLDYVQDLQAISDEVKTELLDSQSLSRAVTSRAAFLKFYKLQFLSTFPAAGDLMLRNRLDLTKDSIRREILEWESRDVAQIPVFLAHKEEIIRDSPKLEWILRCLDQMESDEEMRSLPATVSKKMGKKSEKLVTEELRLKKMVIICPRMAEAVFLFLGLKKSRARLNPVFFHGDLWPQQRREIMTNFRSLKQGSPQIFIAPFDAAGTGLNLQVANYQILTGPLRMKDNEEQCFGRTNRQGQQLTVHHFLLLADDNPLDRLVVTTQANRKIISDPFDVTSELSLESLDNMKEEE